MAKILNIAVITSELDPFSKTGGLADVSRSLSKALRRLGHRVIVITPLYKTVDRKKFKLKRIIEGMSVNVDKDLTKHPSVWEGKLLNNLPVYFIDHASFFSRSDKIYGHKNNNQRFLFFNLACLKLLEELKYHPDILLCHDWQSGLIPYLLSHPNGLINKDFFEKTATVFTIHNLVYQLGHNWWQIPPKKRDNGQTKLPNFENPALENINFAKRAILNAEIINTVSETYAKEILEKESAQDLHLLLRNRQDRVFGIINGIDYKDYNPSTDLYIYENYSKDKLEGKLKNKLALQRKLKLPQRPNVPLLAMVTRIIEQKGFDLLINIFDTLMFLDLQLVILGSGEKSYESFLKKQLKKHPKRLGISFKFDPKMANKFFAASDIFLMPSRFEPCGITQMYSMRYGSIPIVRATGGLVDTVVDYNIHTGAGNGFVFKRYRPQSFLVAIVRALETYKHQPIWEKLVKKVMTISYSWELPAKKYLRLFRKAIKIKERNQKHLSS